MNNKCEIDFIRDFAPPCSSKIQTLPKQQNGNHQTHTLSLKSLLVCPFFAPPCMFLRVHPDIRLAQPGLQGQAG